MTEGNTLTQDQVIHVKKLHEEYGLGVRSIVRRTGLPYPWVRTLLSAPHVGGKTPKLNDGEVKEVLRLFLSGECKNAHELARKYKVNYYTIRWILESNGYFIKQRQITFSDEEQADIVSRYGKLESIASIAGSYKCSQKPILGVLRRRGVVLRDSKHARKHRHKIEHVMPASVLAGRRARAIRLGIGWSITIEDIDELFRTQLGRCYYTHIEMQSSDDLYVYSEKMRLNPYAVSIDRRNSLGGYTKDNIVLCCRWVNYAKNQFPEEIFREALHTAAHLICEMEARVAVKAA